MSKKSKSTKQSSIRELLPGAVQMKEPELILRGFSPKSERWYFQSDPSITYSNRAIAQMAREKLTGRRYTNETYRRAVAAGEIDYSPNAPLKPTLGKHEASVHGALPSDIPPKLEEIALRMERGDSLSKAARAVGLKPARARKYAERAGFLARAEDGAIARDSRGRIILASADVFNGRQRIVDAYLCRSPDGPVERIVVRVDTSSTASRIMANQNGSDESIGRHGGEKIITLDGETFYLPRKEPLVEAKWEDRRNFAFNKVARSNYVKAGLHTVLVDA